MWNYFWSKKRKIAIQNLSGPSDGREKRGEPPSEPGNSIRNDQPPPGDHIGINVGVARIAGSSKVTLLSQLD